MQSHSRHGAAWPVAAAISMVSIVLLSGCASTPPPLGAMAVGRAAVERADSTASAQAPVMTASARDKLQRASMAYAAKDYDQARRLAEQAEADAELAQAQGRAVRADRALTEVREGIRQLREEMARP